MAQGKINFMTPEELSMSAFYGLILLDYTHQQARATMLEQAKKIHSK